MSKGSNRRVDVSNPLIEKSAQQKYEDGWEAVFGKKQLDKVCVELGGKCEPPSDWDGKSRFVCKKCGWRKALP